MTPSHCFSRAELKKLELAAYGDEVYINRSVQFFGTRRIRIGSHVRIDAFCVISAGDGEMGVTIGSYIHLSAGVMILGSGGVTMEDFSTLSANVCVFSSSDDYSGGAMSNPMVPSEFRNVAHRPVVFRKHALVGSGSVVLPGVTVGLGAAVGALTVLRKDVPAFAIVGGNPARRLGTRDRSLLEREEDFVSGRKRRGLSAT